MSVAVVDADHTLIQIVDSALAEVTRRSGAWLRCALGCTQCCIGAFPISALDNQRLQRGLAKLEINDPDRAVRVRQRARESVARLADTFPGDCATGLLDETPEGETLFDGFANDEACPALDPATGGCDLYAWRPMTCRLFGPPLRSQSDAVGICELCFVGASDHEINACAVDVDLTLEDEILGMLEPGSTIVAFSLAR